MSAHLINGRCRTDRVLREAGWYPGRRVSTEE
jgi:hypothetical protein